MIILDSCIPDRIGPVEKEIEFEPFQILQGGCHDIGIRTFEHELLHDPFQGAVPNMKY